jgi:chromosome segregation ATPase
MRSINREEGGIRLEVNELANDESKQILIAIAEIKTNMTNMSAQIDKISKISDLVLETDQRAKSAHNRIDDLKAEYERKLKDQKEDYEEKIRDQKESLTELKGHITWLWRAFGSGLITFVFGIILFFVTK